MYSLNYCHTRKNLEEKIWFAVEQYSSITRRMVGFGVDSSALYAAQCECTEVRAQLSEARFALGSHRSDHGC
jgi:hypothetical protein